MPPEKTLEQVNWEIPEDLARALEDARRSPKVEEFRNKGDLRDRFAGEAMGSILSHERNILALATGGFTTAKLLATDAYIMADAMIKIREH